SYTKAQIGHAGPFSYAPTQLDADANGTPIKVFSCADFFNKHQGRVTVVNGVDTTTNNHDVGSRITWSGQTSERSPAFAALVAGLATSSTPRPLAFLSGGGYDARGGVVPLTRVGNFGAVQKLAYPNTQTPGDPKSPFYHTPTTASRIAAAQSARLQALKSQ